MMTKAEQSASHPIITEVVNSSVQSGDRAQLTLSDDKVLIQIGDQKYELNLSFLEGKIFKHKQK